MNQNTIETCNQTSALRVDVYATILQAIGRGGHGLCFTIDAWQAGIICGLLYNFDAGPSRDRLVAELDELRQRFAALNLDTNAKSSGHV
jgi:hypothetical protein